MSPGAIAMTAVVLDATTWIIVALIVAWLIYTRRILLAASPKPQAPKQDKDAPVEPVATMRRPA